MKDLLLGLALVSCPATVFLVFGISGLEAFDEGAEPVSYSTQAQEGRIAFAEECAGCHGRLAGGTERGPDLIHPDFGRSARSDTQFRRAVRDGIPAPRGRYGAMPALNRVSERKLDHMIAFVRELQRVNDIR